MQTDFSQSRVIAGRLSVLTSGVQLPGRQVFFSRFSLGIGDEAVKLCDCIRFAVVFKFGVHAHPFAKSVDSYHPLLVPFANCFRRTPSSASFLVLCGAVTY